MEKKHHRRSESEVSRMVGLYERGMSMEEVGAQFGISKQRVEQIFNKTGTENRKFTKSVKFIAAQKGNRYIIPRELIVELYTAKKLPVKQIIKTLKISSGTFYRNLAHHKIQKRIDQGIGYSILTRELLHRLYLEENLTATEIARQLGFALVTIKNTLSTFGIKYNKYKKPVIS